MLRLKSSNNGYCVPLQYFVELYKHFRLEISLVTMHLTLTSWSVYKGQFHEQTNHADERKKTADERVTTKKYRSAWPI